MVNGRLITLIRTFLYFCNTRNAMVETSKKNLGLRVAGAVFGVVAALHLWRAVVGAEAQIASLVIPAWLSWVAFVVAAMLSMWLFMLAKD
jgi:hypothetical protein